jgi:hypothetical protein
MVWFGAREPLRGDAEPQRAQRLTLRSQAILHVRQPAFTRNCVRGGPQPTLH